jgi:FtsP/CotA-like multicopper oxidase with cupredoxin domain
VGKAAPSRQLLGLVDVKPGRTVPADITGYVRNALVAAAHTTMPADVRSQVVADLRNGLQLSRFVPHPDIAQNEVTGTQSLVFNIVPGSDTTPTQFQVNRQPFLPGRIDRTLILGNVDEWTLTSDFVSHPFHIHVNPFHAIKILNPNGKVIFSIALTEN